MRSDARPAQTRYTAPAASVPIHVPAASTVSERGVTDIEEVRAKREWPVVTLAEAGLWGSGGTPRRGVSGYYDGHIPWLKIGDLNDGVVTDAEEAITELGLRESSAKLVPEGALLVAMYGSIGKLGIAGRELATNQAIAHCVVNGEFNIEFLFYYLLMERANLLGEGKGGSQDNISQTVLKAYPLPKPPVEEQRRIVGVVKAAMAEVREARARVEAVPAKVKALKASILDAAFRGELTADWRAQHPIPPQAPYPCGDDCAPEGEGVGEGGPNTPDPRGEDRAPERQEGVPAKRSRSDGLAALPSPEFDEDADPMEPASALLQRILAERRVRWEQAHRAKQASKPQTLNPKPKTLNYKDPAPPDVANLADLPETWCYVRLASVITTGSGGTPSRRNGSNFGGGIPWVKSGELDEGTIWHSLETLSLDGFACSSVKWYEPGTVLIAMYGATIGRVGVLGIRATVNQAVCAFSADHQGFADQWVYWLARSLTPSLIGHGTGGAQPNVSQELIQELPIPLAPLPEQREIVRRVETAFKEADALAAAADSTLAALKRLEQSVLAAAFSGEI